ncbi:MAG: flagellar hook-length control protein FliK [bacterium]|nr:flagellar hook-length control protein FliK [bacterium]
MSAALIPPPLPTPPPAAAPAAVSDTGAPAAGDALAEIGASVVQGQLFELALHQAANILRGQVSQQNSLNFAEGASEVDVPVEDQTGESEAPAEDSLLTVLDQLTGAEEPEAEIRTPELPELLPVSTPQPANENLTPIEVAGRVSAGTGTEEFAAPRVFEAAPQPVFQAGDTIEAPREAMPQSHAQADTNDFGSSPQHRDPEAALQDPGFAGSNNTNQESAQTAPRAEALAISDPTALRESRETGRDVRALPELPARTESEIVRELRVLAHEGGGTARITLNPPQLGDLRVQVTIGENGVSVSLLADNMPVADLLVRHLAELRQSLESHGLRIDQFDVDSERAEDSYVFGKSPEQDRGSRSRGEDSSPAGFTSNGAPLIHRSDINTLGTVDIRI